MRVVIWFGATALAVALTPSLSFSHSDTKSLLAALRHPDVEVRQVALDRLLREGRRDAAPEGHAGAPGTRLTAAQDRS